MNSSSFSVLLYSIHKIYGRFFTIISSGLLWNLVCCKVPHWRSALAMLTTEKLLFITR